MARRRVGETPDRPDPDREMTFGSGTGPGEGAADGDEGASTVVVEISAVSFSGRSIAEREGESGTDMEDGGVGRAVRES